MKKRDNVDIENIKELRKRGCSLEKIKQDLSINPGITQQQINNLIRDYYQDCIESEKERYTVYTNAQFAVLSVMVLLIFGGLLFYFEPEITGLVTSMAIGDAYYVDATDGDDSNDGLSAENAIKTISEVNSLSLDPGDVVLFKRGETWRMPEDAYISLDNGDASGHITYSAYGTGEKPLFLGSIRSNNTDDWNDEGGNIWSYKDLIDRDVGNIIYNDAESFGIKEWSLGELAGEGQGHYFYDSTTDRLYLYSTSNPATFYSEIELAVKRWLFYVENKRYIILDNLSLSYGAAHGISGANTHHIIIRNCDISYIGGGSHLTPPMRYGNGVEFWSDAHDNLIEYNRIWQIWDAALTDQASSTYDRNVYNITYRYNQVWNAEYCYEFFQSDESAVCEDIIFDHNTCYNIGWTWGADQRVDPSGGSCFRCGTQRNIAVNVRFTNNICYKNADYFIRFNDPWDGWDNDDNLTSDYNLYYKSSSPYALWGPLAWKTYTSFATFQSETGKEAHSETGNPQFHDVNSLDFRPEEGSPACDLSSTGSYVGALPCVNAPVCGDETCEGTENCLNCEEDCGVCPPVCGDETCEGTENCSNCEEDCGVCPPVCGDETCEGTENCTNCHADCGVCPPVCGDATCEGAEDCSNCQADCRVCAPVCGDATCEGAEDCSNCQADCGVCAPVCGDATCEGAEDCSNCQADCGVCAPVCGDATCEGAEDCSNCQADCGVCAPENETITSCTLEDQSWDEGNSLNNVYNLSSCFNDQMNLTLNYSVTGYSSINVSIDEQSIVNLNSPADWDGIEYIVFNAHGTDKRNASTNIVTLTVVNVPVCGDDSCESGETCSSCSADCGQCKSSSGGGSSGGSNPNSQKPDDENSTTPGNINNKENKIKNNNNRGDRVNTSGLNATEQDSMNQGKKNTQVGSGLDGAVPLDVENPTYLENGDTTTQFFNRTLTKVAIPLMLFIMIAGIGIIGNMIFLNSRTGPKYKLKKGLKNAIMHRKVVHTKMKKGK